MKSFAILLLSITAASAIAIVTGQALALAPVIASAKLFGAPLTQTLGLIPGIWAGIELRRILERRFLQSKMVNK